MGYLDGVSNINRLFDFQQSMEDETEKSEEFCPICRCQLEVKEDISGDVFLECWNCGYGKEVDKNA
jgi:hypothetical protein